MVLGLSKFPSRRGVPEGRGVLAALFAVSLFLGCVDAERSNPYDENGNNFNPSLLGWVSSSSVLVYAPSSSSVGPGYSSPVPSSGSLAPSSGSQEPSSGSQVPSSGSQVPSSSSNAGGSSSSLVYHTLTTNVEPAGGGTIIPNPSGSSHVSGTPVTLNATASSGYKFVSWTGTTSGSAPVLNITMNKDMEITANFTPTYIITVTTYPPEGGTVTPSSAEPYTEGTDVTLTAVPKTDYMFIGWSGDVTSDKNSIAITIGTENVSLTATFSRAFTLTASAEPANGGTIKFSKPGPLYPYPPFENVTLTAEPNANYVFTNWEGDAADNDISTNVSMNNNKTVKARFARTVKIGEKTWMAENLHYAASGSRCYGINNDYPTYCDVYGRLYDWATAMALPSTCNSSSCQGQVNSTHRGVCPLGWHIPTSAEWDNLYRSADGTSGTESPYESSLAGLHLKAASFSSGNDTYNFSALPGGFCWTDVNCNYLNQYAIWWSSSEYDSEQADNRYLRYDRDHAYYRLMGYYTGYYTRTLNKTTQYNVRCVKD